MKAEKALKIFSTQPSFLCCNIFLRGNDMNKIKNLTIRFFLFLILLSAYSLPLKATIHYVQHGQGNIPPYLSWQDAADSIQSAINVCAPGDTIIVANGVYYEDLVISSIPIYLLGSSMDSTVIDGTGLSDSTIFFDNSTSTIENFNIWGRGIGSYSYAVAYQDLALSIKNCRISRTGYGVVSIGNAGVSAYNIILETITVHGFGLFNNNNNIISNCLVLLNTEQSSGIYIGGPNPNAIYTIMNNMILFTGIRNPGQGIYIGLAQKVYIYNNLISKFLENIYVDGIADTVFIKNDNLCYSNYTSVFTDGATYNIIVNDINLTKNNIGINGGTQTKSDYNIFWKNNLNLYNVNYGDSDMVRDPMFVNDTLPNAQLDFDYHLQAYSPGIDKGDPAIIDVDSTRSDIGLYGGPFGETYTYQNLAPRAPINLSAVVSKLNNTITLSWNHNSEADTAYYNVYRDTTENFIIGPAKFVGSASDTSFTEPIPIGAESLYYKITAVDLDFNESLPSEEIFIDIITGVKDEQVTINNYRLYQNYPNPFNPSTKIGYRLKERGYVKLMVYDIKGELVTVLVNDEQNTGYYEVEFSGTNLTRLTDGQVNQIRTIDLASGIYLYRIEIIGEGNIPRFSDMKKMILIK